MALLPINFAISSYKARSGLLSSERMVNMYAEFTPQQAPFKVAIYGTPGLEVWKNLDIFFPIYGTEQMGDELFVVAGVRVYKLNTAGTQTLIGTMGTVPGRVMMTNNGTQVTILTESGIAYYCTTTAGSLLQITDGDYVTSNSVTTMDGFTIFTNQESTRYQISNLNATEIYDALDFDNVLADSSDLVRAISNNLEVWFFKENITLVYYNSGNATFPFERKNGILIQKGCAAKFSVATLDNAFYFLGSDRIVYKTSGYQLVQCSTFPISKEIESYAVVNDAFGFTYTQEGHKFYVLTFPSANKTWVYDITADLWHERESLYNSQDGRWRANSHTFFAGKNLVGDNMTSKLYELDLDKYTEDETPIIAKMISATQFDENRRDAVGELVLVMDTGVGISYGQGYNPNIMMRTSIDGGKTWSNQLNQPLGHQGEYEKEVVWNRIAYGRSLILEVTISDPVKRAINAAYMLTGRGQS